MSCAKNMLTVDAALLVGAAGLVRAHGSASVFDAYVAGVARVGPAGRLTALLLITLALLANHLERVADASVAAGAADRTAVLVCVICAKKSTSN